MIIGIGVDLVDVTRFERKVEQTPNLLTRLFTDEELAPAGEAGQAHSRSLAGKFAAKEALVKALQGPEGLSWHEVNVRKDASGAPRLELSGKSAEVARARGIAKFHVSISHDGSNAIAFVIAEGGE